jgi:hypothetical protein
MARARRAPRPRLSRHFGGRKSIKLEGRALHNNPEVLRLQGINALNPQTQVVFCNSGNCPSILGGSFAAAPGA